MSKGKFQAVKELIEEEEYDEARKILKTIHHPAAKTLLKELDELDTEQKSRSGLFALLSLFLVLVVILATAFILRQPQIPSLSTANIGTTPDTSIARTSFPTPVQTPQVLPVAAMTSTASANQEAMRLSIYTFCMRKNDDQLCHQIASSESLQRDSKVINCFRLFAGALDDFGTCIHPQYATAYNDAWKLIYPATVVPDLCKTLPREFGIPDNSNTAQICTQHSHDMVSRNPYSIVDSCFDKYLSWNTILDLTDEEINQHMTNFALCVWQRPPLSDE